MKLSPVRLTAGFLACLVVLLSFAAQAKKKQIVRNDQGMEAHIFRTAVDTKGHFTVDTTPILPHMAINPIKLEKSRKGGIQTKRLKAAWDNNYLMKIMPAYFFLRLSWIIWELRLTFVLGCRRR